MCSHGIGPVKRLVAARALPHSIGQPVVDAAVAEDVTAPLKDGVFEVTPADGADNQILKQVSQSPES
jgi:hypothetical protein